MRLRTVTAMLTALIVLMMPFPMPMFSSIASTSSIKDGLNAGVNGNPIRIYVLSLSGVDAYPISNLSRVIEGVLMAAKVNNISVWSGAETIWGPEFKDVEINVATQVVDDWVAYQVLVEFGVNLIIVNAHGEYLPVPSGYTRNDWIDKIADAMLNRQLTWVHVAGYPFYYVQYQDGEIERCEKVGFQNLLSHIGKGNVNCTAPENNLHSTLTGFAGQELERSWRFIYDGEHATMGSPLKRSDFEELLVLGLYRRHHDHIVYYSGAVIRFTSENNTLNFGFYVHLSSEEYYDLDYSKTEMDYFVGYIGTAAAIWSEVGLTAYLLNEEVPEAIKRARATGRTQGLDQAESLLQQAIDTYNSSKYKSALALAYQANEAATNATKPPNYLALYGPYAFILGISGIVAFLIVQSKRKETKMTRLGFTKCPICNKYIKKDEIQEHENICFQTHQKKRKRHLSMF